MRPASVRSRLPRGERADANASGDEERGLNLRVAATALPFAWLGRSTRSGCASVRQLTLPPSRSCRAAELGESDLLPAGFGGSAPCSDSPSTEWTSRFRRRVKRALSTVPIFAPSEPLYPSAGRGMRSARRPARRLVLSMTGLQVAEVAQPGWSQGVGTTLRLDGMVRCDRQTFSKSTVFTASRIAFSALFEYLRCFVPPNLKTWEK